MNAPTGEYACSRCGKVGHNKTTCGKTFQKTHTDTSLRNRNGPMLRSVTTTNASAPISDAAKHLEYIQNVQGGNGGEVLKVDEGGTSSDDFHYRGEYIGEVGAPATVVGVVKFTKSFPSNYGFFGSNVLVVSVVKGSDVSFYSAADWVYYGNLAKGDFVAVEGVVTKHETYGEVKQTKMKRVKLLKKVSPEETALED